MAAPPTHSDQINAILDRGVVATVLPSEDAFKKAFAGDERRTLYLGIDPTAPSLHLGHAQNVLLLEDFRALGHEVIILMGDFTATIGDPSGRLSTRAPLSQEEVEENSKHIVAQLKNIINLDDPENPARIEHNGSWLRGLTFEEVLQLSSYFTVQQMIERDMFANRIQEQKPVFLHEFLYPLMQGYDSVAMEVDAEVGGTDQTFNMLAGRTLLKKIKDKEKFVITTNLIQNPKTGELMSKSLGTGVFIDTPPEELFGQMMAQPDEMVRPLLVGVTRLPLDQVETLASHAEQGGEKARDAKLAAAEEVVSVFHSKNAARAAREEFVAVFSQGKTPDAPEEISWDSPEETLVDLIVKSGLARSKTAARRLIHDGAVEVDEKIEKDPQTTISLTKDGVLVRVGKHRFARITY